MVKRIIGLVLVVSLIFSVMGLEAATISGGGRSSSFAIRYDGSLWAWGWNQFGQLGDGTSISRVNPMWIMDDIISISIQRERVVAVGSDGTLWTWGSGLYHEYIADEDGFYWPVNRYTPFALMDNVVTASAQLHHAEIIRADGSTWYWNWDLRVEPREATNGRNEFFDDIIASSITSRHSLILRSDGSLWAYGDNVFGAIGDGVREEHEYRYMRVYGLDEYVYMYLPDFSSSENIRNQPVKIMDDVITISANVRHSVAIRSDRSLWAWGYNDTGRVGDGTTYTRLRPVRVIDNVIDVSAGYNHTLALRTDGTLWGWGSNWFGELVDETLGHDGSTAPVQILDNIMLPTNIPIRVIVNGRILALDTNPTTINDRTLVPFRAIFEALDMDVEWDGETQTAIGIGEGTRIELPVGASVAYVNGERNTLDAPAVIYNDRTLVPLRFIAEAVGADVSWDSGMRIVRVSM